MKANPVEVGKRIRRLRKEKGLTMVTLGKMIGAPQSAISNWEKGDNLPNATRLNKLSEVFEQTIDEILFGTLEEKIGNWIYEILGSSSITQKERDFLNKNSHLLIPFFTKRIREINAEDAPINLYIQDRILNLAQNYILRFPVPFRSTFDKYISFGNEFYYSDFSHLLQLLELDPKQFVYEQITVEDAHLFVPEIVRDNIDNFPFNDQEKDFLIKHSEKLIHLIEYRIASQNVRAPYYLFMLYTDDRCKNLAEAYGSWYSNSVFDEMNPGIMPDMIEDARYYYSALGFLNVEDIINRMRKDSSEFATSKVKTREKYEDLFNTMETLSGDELVRFVEGMREVLNQAISDSKDNDRNVDLLDQLNQFHKKTFIKAKEKKNTNK